MKSKKLQVNNTAVKDVKSKYISIIMLVHRELLSELAPHVLFTKPGIWHNDCRKPDANSINRSKDIMHFMCNTILNTRREQHSARSTTSHTAAARERYISGVDRYDNFILSQNRVI